MAKNKGLGRDLDFILSDTAPEAAGGITMLRISDVEPRSDQPRKFFDSEALSQLAESIAANGVLQPIIVRRGEDGYYSIIAGERRWRASKLAGLTEIPCIIKDADELEAAQIALIENIQREDLNSYEEAKAYNALIDQFSLSQEEVARRLGKSRSAIANSLRLLDLPEEISELLKNDKISAGHCRALLGLRDKSLMAALANKIVHRNLSVREAESTVKTLNAASARGEKPTMPEGVNVNYLAVLERRATDMLGRRCRISGGKNRRVIQIEYTDNADLESILVGLCGKEIIDE